MLPSVLHYALAAVLHLPTPLAAVLHHALLLPSTLAAVLHRVHRCHCYLLSHLLDLTLINHLGVSRVVVQQSPFGSSEMVRWEGDAEFDAFEHSPCFLASLPQVTVPGRLRDERNLNLRRNAMRCVWGYKVK